MSYILGRIALNDGRDEIENVFQSSCDGRHDRSDSFAIAAGISIQPLGSRAGILRLADGSVA